LLTEIASVPHPARVALIALRGLAAQWLVTNARKRVGLQSWHRAAFAIESFPLALSKGRLIPGDHRDARLAP
jgi:hypothetical protein